MSLSCTEVSMQKLLQCCLSLNNYIYYYEWHKKCLKSEWHGHWPIRKDAQRSHQKRQYAALVPSAHISALEFGFSVLERFLSPSKFYCDHIWLFMIAVVLICDQKTHKLKTENMHVCGGWGMYVCMCVHVHAMIHYNWYKK